MRKGQKVEDEYLKAALWEDRPEAWQEIVKGVKRRILTHSPVGTMVLYRIETKSVFASHSHPHAQFGVFLEGGGDFKVGDSVWKVKKGDSYYVPPGVMHELKTAAGQQSIVLDFFTPERQDYHPEALAPDRG